VVLAGVGSVTVVDDTPCAEASPANFLIPADADATQRCEPGRRWRLRYSAVAGTSHG